MGCYLRHALGSFAKLLPDSQHAAYFGGLLKAGQKATTNAETNKVLKRHFEDAFGASNKGLVDAMISYVASHPVRLYATRNEADDGHLIPKKHLPQHGDINALARVIVLMSEPMVHNPSPLLLFCKIFIIVYQVQDMWHAVANESRDREAIDSALANRKVVNEVIETSLLTNYFNSAAYTAPNTVNLSPYVISSLDPSKPPEQPKSLVWFREQRRFLRVCMAGIQTRVVKHTGDGEQGADGSDSDTKFWKYCRGDVLVMFMWLHWGRGFNVPSHCSAMLDEDCTLDIGLAEHPRSAGSSSRSTTVTSPSLSSSNLDRVLQKIDDLITSPLLHNLMNPQVAAQASDVCEAQKVAALADAKSKVVAALAARIQAFNSVLSMADETKVEMMREKMGALVAEMLAFDN